MVPGQRIRRFPCARLCPPAVRISVLRFIFCVFGFLGLGFEIYVLCFVFGFLCFVLCFVFWAFECWNKGSGLRFKGSCFGCGLRVSGFGCRGEGSAHVVVAVAVAALLLELHHVGLLRGVEVQLLENVLRIQQLRVDLPRREEPAGGWEPQEG